MSNIPAQARDAFFDAFQAQIVPRPDPIKAPCLSVSKHDDRLLQATLQQDEQLDVYTFISSEAATMGRWLAALLMKSPMPALPGCYGATVPGHGIRWISLKAHEINVLYGLENDEH